MRTARAQGVSVNSIAKRFGITRQTVWEKTRSSMKATQSPSTGVQFLPA